jgi:hypothetical protein
MCLNPVGPVEEPAKDYSGWPLRNRLEPLAFDARLAEVLPALLEALWEAIDLLPYAEMPLREVIRRRYSACDGQSALSHDSEARLIAFSD